MYMNVDDDVNESVEKKENKPTRHAERAESN